MMISNESRGQSVSNETQSDPVPEADYIYGLLTSKHGVSRRNRASWYLKLLNKLASCELDSLDESQLEQESNDDDEDEPKPQPGPEIGYIKLVSMTNSNNQRDKSDISLNRSDGKFLITPNTRAVFLSRQMATSIILDLSPSVISVCPQNSCVFMDLMFDALKKVLHLLVKNLEIPSSTGDPNFVLEPKVFVSVIAYTPFVAARNNQVVVQNRRLTADNLDQFLIEAGLTLRRLTDEIYELVSNTCAINLNLDTSKNAGDVFIYPQPLNGSVMRHPGAVLEDIFEIGSFSSSLMPRPSRLSIIAITDGLLASTNNLKVFRLSSIALSFVTLGSESVSPDGCFGYAPYTDLLKFISKTTLGVHMTYDELVEHYNSISSASCVSLYDNPVHKLFCWSLHSDECQYDNPTDNNPTKQNGYSDEIRQSDGDTSKFYRLDNSTQLQQLVGDSTASPDFDLQNHNDWRSFKQLERNLNSDFEQVLACLLREGYLIKSVQLKRAETSKIVARLVLHWRHNLDFEQELTAPYWNNTDSFDMSTSSHFMLKPFSTPIYGDTFCELIVHGSYSFLHNLYYDRKHRKKSEYRDLSYRQYKQLIDGVAQTHERLQYLSRFYRESSLSIVPAFLLHGNSLLYEQPHTHKLTSTVENVMNEADTTEFQQYWQRLPCLDAKSWTNLMHIHTLRLVLEHDQPKHKNIHYQNANGRYTHVQCRRALTVVSNFIKSYASFALLEDSLYVKFIYNNDDDLREIETSATKGFIVIRINKLLPIIVVHLMFTSGILDSHRVRIVSYIERELVRCKLRNIKSPPGANQIDNLLKTKTICQSGDSCCVLIKSPLERMLKIYGRNYIAENLMNNWSDGLPGSYPISIYQPVKRLGATNSVTKPRSENKDRIEENQAENQISRLSLVFGKYLYGVRIIQTITKLPHDILTPLAADVLSKISAILANVRIKQGFHIAFNSSGIMNLVCELSMKDASKDEDKPSSCLCQYIVFPPTVIQASQNLNAVLGLPNGLSSSKPGSLSGSLANSDSYIRSVPETTQSLKDEVGSIKVIKEYWIEQQYGLSQESESYHSSLSGLRYSQIVDHLHLTDLSIFECLLAYNLLQLFCDNLSTFYDHDIAFVGGTSTVEPISPSPTTSSVSLESYDATYQPNRPILPSTFIEGHTKDSYPRIPLIDFDYKLSLTKFLDYCQLASVNILMFQTRSEMFANPDKPGEPVISNNRINSYKTGGFSSNKLTNVNSSSLVSSSKVLPQKRRMSAEANESSFEATYEKTRREHRSSYQQGDIITQSYTAGPSIVGTSLNNVFLETLQKRLRQMHDKELVIPESDLKLMPLYLRKRLNDKCKAQTANQKNQTCLLNLLDDLEQSSDDETKSQHISWRCFMRKRNQENLMIVLIPSTLEDVNKWLDLVEPDRKTTTGPNKDPVCPLLIFRCSSNMINDQILHFLNANQSGTQGDSPMDKDVSFHFGQPCMHAGRMEASNDELSSDILSNVSGDTQDASNVEDRTNEVFYFKVFLRKVKNTVLKSRFSSLNDAYLSELFINKDDVLYYINNVDIDLQKKYHVPSQLRSLSEFIKSYENYQSSLPREPGKPCNQLLNSILLQKCGLFINQPIARYDESNPLIRHIHDRKLLFFIKCNYKVDLPVVEDSLANSTYIRDFVRTSTNTMTGNQSVQLTGAMFPDHRITSSIPPVSTIRSDSSKLSESMKPSSLGSSSMGSPSSLFPPEVASVKSSRTHRLSSSSAFGSIFGSPYENFILEAFRGSKLCAMKDVPLSEATQDVALRHEAHMAVVLRKTTERKEAHYYRKTLKSRTNYNQSHQAIDQALRRVDSLGRLEHFCLTPLLFSPSWRTKLAPVRDHAIEAKTTRPLDSKASSKVDGSPLNLDSDNIKNEQSGLEQQQQQQQQQDERWHQILCNNYIKEYEQYIQTLGFNSVQVRYQNQPKVPSVASQVSIDKLAESPSQAKQSVESISRKVSVTAGQSSTSVSSTGYLIKFLNSGCLVFKVGFCVPYVYSILYSIEGERFNNSNAKIDMTSFLDELDSIKVTMHLHSFTYDYHLRSMYSYLSGRQLTFYPGYHLTSFLDDFRKYYQKPPNYARNHILCGDLCIKNIKVTGQQLYNYIVTHNSVYGLEVMEMSTLMSNLAQSLNGLHLISGDNQHRPASSPRDLTLDVNSAKGHANDYVLIELKRERVHYRDGKDPDIFDCALLITHDFQGPASSSKTWLSLKYFLLLTNQRDLYPKLVHSFESVISLGCHRPIRLGMTSLKPKEMPIEQAEIAAPSTKDTSLEPDDKDSEKETSGEHTPQSDARSTSTSTSASASAASASASNLALADSQSAKSVASNNDEPTLVNDERTICDEEITYLGYFSSDEMDVLRFLQEKTSNLRQHIEQVVRQAEVHYRRDYLWHKLMQRTSASPKSDELPLSIDELNQLLSIVEAIDLSTLDPQLTAFSTMHLNWYKKLFAAFLDLRQSSVNFHRIYIVVTPKSNLIYIDPNCTSAFISLSVDNERGSIELNLILKDRDECSKLASNTKTGSNGKSDEKDCMFELDQDCRQLISDFVNFCATFMWSTFLVN